MSGRIGPGPVFVFESLIFARRWQVYAGRALFVLAILGGLWISWWIYLYLPLIGAPVGARPDVLQLRAKAAELFFYSLAMIQLTMVLLVAPAATAGAICHDRARGILAQMAITELSAAEIVLGKLSSRLAPIFGLLACGLPVTALAALLGGIDFQALFSLFVVSAAIAVLGCALALAVSLRVARTHEALMAVLALWTWWLMSLPIWSGMARTSGVTPPPDWFKKANPYLLVYAPYAWPGYVEPLDVILFVAVALAASAALAGLTIAGLRRAPLPMEDVRRARPGWAAALRWLGSPGRPGGRSLSSHFPTLRRWPPRWPGPSLDGNPVLWREWHRNRPSRMTRILWGTYGLGAIAGTGIGVASAIAYGMDTPGGNFALTVSLSMQSFLGMMLLSGQAPTALGEERVRGSLDVLMATPISTRAIVWGKWMGTFRIAIPLAILPGLAAAIMACAVPGVPPMVLGRFGTPMNLVPVTLLDRIATPALVVGEMLSYGAVITSLGLLLATWIPRVGRAVAINVAAFVLVAVGWPLFCEMFPWRLLQARLVTRSSGTGVDYNWILRGMAQISPLVGPTTTLDVIGRAWWNETRGKYHLFTLAWCLLAWAFAGVLYWAVLRTFDRRMGRMRETSPPEDDSGVTIV